jgi:conjugal transfer mating pair stabilization protein TraN
LQTNAQQAVTQALSVCRPVLQALAVSANVLAPQVGTASQDYAAIVQIPGLASQIQGELLQANTQLQNVLEVYSKGLPYCDAIASSDAYTYASQEVTNANAVATSCTSLPTSVTATTAASVVAQLGAAATAYSADATASGVRAVTAEMRSAAALMATTNNGTLSIANLMGPYTTGGSSTLGTNTGNPLVNVLNDPANSALVGVLNQVVKSTDPTSLVPAGSGIFDVCSSTATKVQTQGSSGTISPVTTPQIQPSGQVSVCVDGSRSNPIPGVAGPQWVYIPAVPGQCNGTRAAGTFMMATTMPYTATGTSGNTLNLYFSAVSDANATVQITSNTGISQSTNVAGTDTLVQGASGSTAAPNLALPLSTPSSITTVDVTVTLSSPGDFAMSLSNYSTSYVQTDATWYTPPTAQTTIQVVSKSGATVSIPTPSAVQSQVSCKAAFQCLGTQCHSIMGTQDQSFSSATAGLAMLQSIAQNASCAPGTSEAAGDCALDIFKGQADNCRDFIGSGLGLTSNCCDQPINVSPLSSIIKLAGIAYAEGWVPSYGGSILSNMPDWAQSAYSSTSAWVNTTTSEITSTAGQVWSTVSAPFKSVSASFANAFGAGGPSSMSQVLGTAFNVTGTGTTAPTSNTAGATYTTTGATSGTNVTGGGANISGSIGMVGNLAGMLGGGMQGIADNVIENLFGQAAAPIENAMFGAASGPAAASAGATYTGPVYVDGYTGGTMTSGGVSAPANGSMLGSGIVGDVMAAYAIYEVACLIGHLLTQCNNEEMIFYQNRQHRLCFNVGSYCANSVLGVCVETDYVACCYQSMLDRIVMQQLLAMDPGIVVGSTSTQPYGDPKTGPACDGLTPQSLAAVAAGGYLGRLDFSEYIAYLEQHNMLPSTNTQGAQWLAPTSTHTTGMVNAAGAPATNTAVYSGQ